MISSEVQRTLVKSPPELWAELSDPAALARHLGELGEIRITRVDPEQAVEWEAGDVSGTVLIKPSAWGTKVTLTVSGEIDEHESPATPDSPADAQPTAEAEPEAVAQAEPETAGEESPQPAGDAEPPAEAGPETWHEAIETKPQTAAGVWAEPVDVEPEATVEASPEPTEAELGGEEDEAWPEPIEAEPEPRGFFSRLFRRRRRKEAVEPEASEEMADAEWQPDPPEVVATWEQALESSAALVAVESPQEPVDSPEPVEPHVEHDAWEGWGRSEAHEIDPPSEIDSPTDSPNEEPVDTARKLGEAEDVTAERVTAVLTAVLDRLGAAHHRPFSRG
jgi:hypothetical protein